MTRKEENLRLDHKMIGRLVSEGSRVLDLGCGDGELLEYLVCSKDVQGTGIEINERSIYSCVEKGLSVHHGDIDSGLEEYPDKFFDFVIFNQTMQQVHRPKKAIAEALRIGKKVIVGFPNFCYVRARVQIFFLGHVPVTPSLPYSWYDTPNLHFLSIKDFFRFVSELGLCIEQRFFLGRRRQVKVFPNLFALNAIFLISNSHPPER